MTKRRKRAGDSKIAVAYLRVSTEDQSLGVEAQRSAIEAWAARNDVRIASWHTDQGISGAASLESRPGLLEALASIANRGAGYLVVARRDRLARDVVVSAMVDRLVAREGARIASASGETANNDDPTTVLMTRIIDAFSEYERLLIRSRTKAALAAKKARGERLGTVEYGYSVGDDGKTLVPNPQEQAVIETIKDLHKDGLSTRKIVAELAERGIVSRVGKPLRQTQVVRILHAER